jgi:predicted secreted Zn-dependent protease
MMRHRVLAAVLMGALSLTTGALAEVRITERVEHYPVSGSSSRDLRAQMSQRGRREGDGKVYDANTASNLRWSFTFKTTGDDCRIGSALVLVGVTYHVPLWAERDSAPRAIRAQWDSFIEKLMAHEHKHGSHARQAGEELEQALVATPAARYCEEVERAANDRANEIVRKLQRVNADYDDRTKHGAAEGAVFP